MNKYYMFARGEVLVLNATVKIKLVTSYLSITLSTISYLVLNKLIILK